MKVIQQIAFVFIIVSSFGLYASQAEQTNEYLKRQNEILASFAIDQSRFDRRYTANRPMVEIAYQMIANKPQEAPQAITQLPSLLPYLFEENDSAGYTLYNYDEDKVTVNEDDPKHTSITLEGHNFGRQYRFRCTLLYPKTHHSEGTFHDYQMVFFKRATGGWQDPNELDFYNHYQKDIDEAIEANKDSDSDPLNEFIVMTIVTQHYGGMRDYRMRADKKINKNENDWKEIGSGKYQTNSKRYNYYAQMMDPQDEGFQTKYFRQEKDGQNIKRAQ